MPDSSKGFESLVNEGMEPSEALLAQEPVTEERALDRKLADLKVEEQELFDNAPDSAAAAFAEGLGTTGSVKEAIRVVRIAPMLLERRDASAGNPQLERLDELILAGYKPIGVTKGDVGTDFIYLYRE